MTPADERFTHQLVAPALATLYSDPAWGDRCYHLLHVGDLTVNAGRQLYVNDGRRFAFFGAASPTTQRCVRVAQPFAPGEDPDLEQIGQVAIEVVRPLEEIRIRVDEPSIELRGDLTFTARFPPAAIEPHLVEQEGRPVTHYMNFFQSGFYDGVLELGGREHRIEGRPGFRDRGWGLRKHEGPPRRGLVVAMFCELPEEAIYLILFETATGRRVFTNGWRIDAGGIADTVVRVEHDLELDGTLLVAGTLDVEYASGATQRIRLEVVSRNYLAGVGYSTEERFRASGADAFDLTEPSVVGLLDGQNDNGSRFLVDGVPGHGYIETGFGVHPRYRPEGQTA